MSEDYPAASVLTDPQWTVLHERLQRALVDVGYRIWAVGPPSHAPCLFVFAPWSDADIDGQPRKAVLTVRYQEWRRVFTDPTTPPIWANSGFMFWCNAAPPDPAYWDRVQTALCAAGYAFVRYAVTPDLPYGGLEVEVLV